MSARAATAHRRLAPLNRQERGRHKLRNIVQSAVLLGGMALLLAFCGWVLFGPEGMIGLGLGAGLGLLFSPRISPGMILRMYSASELQPAQLPAVFEIVGRLSARAGLPRRPQLYYIRSPILNAFAVGDRKDAAIALTDGLLRSLSLRELAGVLAHEISHVLNNDLWLMSLADVVGRLTRMMSMLGLVLLILGLPVWLAGRQSVPLILVAALVLAPQIALLLQLALSRAREYDADLDAAGLTGDPAGLASALLKLERHQRGVWERILLPGYRSPEPSILRTHPPTDERVARLKALYGAEPELRPALATDDQHPIAFGQRVSAPPRWRLLGHWY
jgi:heat shock protein HtpX